MHLSVFLVTHLKWRVEIWSVKLTYKGFVSKINSSYILIDCKLLHMWKSVYEKLYNKMWSQSKSRQLINAISFYPYKDGKIKIIRQYSRKSGEKTLLYDMHLWLI